MTILRIVALGVLSIGVFFGLFRQYAKKQMSEFQIDYSHTPGKIIVITGANSGLGYHTSLALAKEKATVIMGCRSVKKCEEAKQSILKEVPHAKLDTFTLDLGSFQSIRQFATKFLAKYHSLDVLVNNAGIMAIPTREVTEDGLELQMGTNHFGHFLLTSLLFPYIQSNGRIINHSSSMHSTASPNFVYKNLLAETSYDPWTVYGNSKLANLYFTFELNRKLQKNGNPKNIIAVAVHPGYTSTNLQASRFPFWEQINAIFAMKGEEGSLSQTFGKQCLVRTLFLISFSFSTR
jgi:NAD(P)-dependent dehydrogenase (short-subunit alcohol dehydrogenase family)